MNKQEQIATVVANTVNSKSLKIAASKPHAIKSGGKLEKSLKQIEAHAWLHGLDGHDSEVWDIACENAAAADRARTDAHFVEDLSRLTRAEIVSRTPVRGSSARRK